MKMRGQSALEFLMTYGWAILVLTVTLGVLFYMGVFNPQGVAPNVCTLPSGISCYTYKIDGNATLTLDIGQATGKKIRVTGIACSKAGSPAPVSLPSPVEIRSGTHKEVTGGDITCLETDDVTPATSSQYYKGNLVISYIEVDTGLPHTITGEIAAQLEGYGGEGPGASPTAPPGPLYMYSGTLYQYPVELSDRGTRELLFSTGQSGREVSLDVPTLDGATVTLRRYGGGTYTDTTSGGGLFSLEVPAGNYTLRIAKSGYDALITDQWFEITGPMTDMTWDVYETWPDGTAVGGVCTIGDDCNTRNCWSFLNQTAHPDLMCISESTSDTCEWCYPCDATSDCNSADQWGMVCDTSTHVCIEESPGSHEYAPPPSPTPSPSPSPSPSPTPTPNCAGACVDGVCDGCGGTISSGGTWVINGDINCDGCTSITAGIVIGASSVTLDCQHHTLTGPGTGNYIHGVDILDGKTGVTVENCDVTNWWVGILGSGNSGNSFLGNTANGNLNGFYFWGGPNSFADNVVCSGASSDLWHCGGGQTDLGGNICSSNSCGIDCGSCPG